MDTDWILPSFRPSRKCWRWMVIESRHRNATRELDWKRFEHSDFAFGFHESKNSKWLNISRVCQDVSCLSVLLNFWGQATFDVKNATDRIGTLDDNCIWCQAIFSPSSSRSHLDRNHFVSSIKSRCVLYSFSKIEVMLIRVWLWLFENTFTHRFRRYIWHFHASVTQTPPKFTVGARFHFWRGKWTKASVRLEESENFCYPSVANCID